MAEFTLLELHLDDSDLTANAPYSSGKKDVVAGEGSQTEDSSSSRKRLFAALIGLAFCGVVAYITRGRLSGDGSDEFDTDIEGDRTRDRLLRIK